MKKLNFLTCLLVLLMLAMNVGYVQADEPVSTTYKLEQVSSVAAGEKYVFVQNNLAMIGQCSSSELQTTTEFSTIGVVGNENYVWTLLSADGGYNMKSVSANKCLKNASSTSLSMSNESPTVWVFTFDNNIAKITTNTDTDRFLGLTSATGTTYKAYKGSSYPNAITVYKLVEDTRTITWQSNKETFATTVPLYGKITLPATSPEACNEMVDEFVGWSKTTPDGASWTKEPTFIQTGDAVDAASAITYYAVFKSKNSNKWYISCPELYAITYKANGGTGEDQVVYYENKTGVTIYDGAAFSKTDCSLYMWTQNQDGSGLNYKPNATNQSLTSLVGEGKTGTLYAQWTGNLTATGNVHLTSGVGISVYTTAPAGNLITISSLDVSLVHHIKVGFKDKDGKAVADADCPFTLCNNGTENFNKVTSITTEGTGSFSQTYSIQYTPTVANQMDTYILHLEGVDQLGKTVYNSADLMLYGRSLPEKFVLAMKKSSDNKWYAIPNVLSESAASAPDAIAIEVDDESNPTAVTMFNPTNSQVLYTSDVRYESGKHRGAIRFKSVANNRYITATATDNTSFYQPSGNNDNQQFYLNSSDLKIYNITLDPAVYTDRWISFNSNQIGWFKTANKNVYLLPVSDTYERELTSDQLGTICLPFAVEEFTGADFYKMSYLEKDEQENPYHLYYEQVDALEAGKPYIFVPSDSKITCKQKGGMVDEPVYYDDGFYGTFTDIADGAKGAADNVLENNYLVYNNIFQKCGGNCSLKAYRAYIDMDKVPKAPAQVPSRRVMVIGQNMQPEYFDPTPGVMTGLQHMDQSEVSVVKLMRDGQLIIMRNNRAYNISGMLIK